MIIKFILEIEVEDISSEFQYDQALDQRRLFNKLLKQCLEVIEPHFDVEDAEWVAITN